MRMALLALLVIVTPARWASAQRGAVIGEVVRHDGGQPLPFAAVALPAEGMQTLANEAGAFALRDVPPGPVRLRVRRIGFAPKDTILAVGSGDTLRVRIVMTQLAVQLPTVVVNGVCADTTPRQAQPRVLAELFDQVQQNAAQMRLLAAERPFLIRSVAVGERRDPRSGEVHIVRVDTVERSPLPANPYRPRQVMRRGEGTYRGSWVVTLPELPDLADSAFTNHHCLWYAGQTRFGADSVIQVDFEPVAWLAKEVDLEGSLYLRVADYQLVGLVTRLNRTPPQNRALLEYSVRAEFTELLSGVPVLAAWVLTNTFRSGAPSFVQVGRVTDVRWDDRWVPIAGTTRVPPPAASDSLSEQPSTHQG